MVDIASNIGDVRVIRVVIVDIGYLECRIRSSSILTLRVELTKPYVSITAKLASGYLFAMSNSYGVR